VSDIDSAHAGRWNWTPPGGDGGALVVEKAVNVVGIGYVDRNGEEAVVLGPESGFVLDFVAEAREPYEGRYYSVVITDRTSEDASVSALMSSLDGEGAVKKEKTLTLARQTAYVYQSPGVILYEGALAPGTESYFDGLGFILMPASLNRIEYPTPAAEAALKKAGARITRSVISFDLDVDNDGKLSAKGASPDGVFKYLPGYVFGTPSIGANGAQAMQIVVDGIAPEIGHVTLRIDPCTVFAGVCGNFGASYDDDYSFAPGANDRGPASPPIDRPGPGAPGGASRQFYCKDYGGACTVTLELRLNAGGALIDSFDLQIPRDTDQDFMADRWEISQLRTLALSAYYRTQLGIDDPPDEARIDLLAARGDFVDSQGNPARPGPDSPSFTNFTPPMLKDYPIADFEEIGGGDRAREGDGIDAFDEYRGFMVGGAHIRTNLYDRDVFVYVPEDAGIEPISTKLMTYGGFHSRVHDLAQGEFNLVGSYGTDATFDALDNGWVNFNSPADTQPQNAVLFRAFSYEFPPATDTPARTVGKGYQYTTIASATPRGTAYIAVYLPTYQNQLELRKASISTHEFCHAMFIEHTFPVTGHTHSTNCLNNYDGWKLSEGGPSAWIWCLDKCLFQTYLRGDWIGQLIQGTQQETIGRVPVQ
jgi:hypothetical protein